MVNRSKNLGTAAESAVVKYLRANGFPHAKRLTLSGRYDLGDVTLGDGWPVTIEVKAGHAAENASDAQIAAWLEEAHKEMDNAENVVGLLILKRKGKSLANAGAWRVFMDTACFLDLLGAAAPEDWAVLGGTWSTSLEFIAQALHARGYELLDSNNRSMENKGNPYSTLDGGEHGNGGSLLGESG